MFIDFAQSVSGFVIGGIVGLTGVGSGSLMTPLLVLMFGIHPATAMGTDLLYAAITKSGGTFVHSKKGHVDWHITGPLSSGSLPTAAITLFSVRHFAPSGLGGASKTITFALGIALVLTALSLIFRDRIRSFSSRHDPDAAHHPALTVVTGAILGCAVSLSSVGAGALGITALFFCIVAYRRSGSLDRTLRILCRLLWSRVLATGIWAMSIGNSLRRCWLISCPAFILASTCHRASPRGFCARCGLERSFWLAKS